ncbi:Rap1a/Tai family immunity protein [Bradyrhizobium sp. CCBAU 21362]|uniref:Rap1a/Tai family immunity protein n=1 Tax=Bradyrhizobium sp. CCBAU 21362 TaxID=1325082 RepID=UPI003FA4AFA0
MVGASTHPSASEPLSGATLLSWCSGTDKSACYGYLRGVAETESAKNAISCPGSATPDQVVTAMHNYLVGNPSVLALPATILAADALRQAFPCSKTSR